MSTPVAQEASDQSAEISANETDASCCVPSSSPESPIVTDAEALAFRFNALTEENMRITGLVVPHPF